MIDKTFIINLKRRQDKKTSMITQLIKLGSYDINYQFFEAVDGNDQLSLQKFQYSVADWFDPHTYKAMTVGEIGCALSHYSVWQNIVDMVKNGILSTSCKVLILEDDIIFSDHFESNLKSYIGELEEVDKSYDMVYLHRKIIDIESETKITTHICKPGRSHWTCSYILTYHGAVKLINANYLKSLIPVDEFLPVMYGHGLQHVNKNYNFEKLNCYSVMPSIISLVPTSTQDSDTFKSSATPLISERNIFTTVYDNEEINFKCLHISKQESDKMLQSDSYNRFVDYCKFYGVPLETVSGDSDEIKNKFSKIKSDISYSENTLLLLIITQDDTAVLPVASPVQFIKKYFMHNVLKNKDIVYGDETYSGSKLILLGYINTVAQIAQADTVNYEYVPDIICAVDSSISDNFKFDTPILYYPNLTCQPTILFSDEIHDRSDIILNRIENYTGNNWNECYGYCQPCFIPKVLPKVYMSKIDNPTCELEYPVELIEIHTTNLKNYKSLYDFYIGDFNNFIKSGCDYYFFIDSNVVITDQTVLKKLLSYNKPVIAPMLRKSGKLWTNFWGDIDSERFYKKSPDYFSIIDRNRTGCWNVPYITSCFLIRKDKLLAIIDNLSNITNESEQIDIDMRICELFREQNIFMYVSNTDVFGFIERKIKIDEHKNNDVTLFDIINDNKKTEWELKYLHKDYYTHMKNFNNMTIQQLCDNIYNFQLFNEQFCKDIIQIAESYGKWYKVDSDNKDSRLGDNYYENVPTVDIHLFEISMQKPWEKIVELYIAPVVSYLYDNYKTIGINMSFIVKYDTINQKSLQPHHDASTYTVNVALNAGNGIDYDGGGCRFIRQNYVLKNQNPGMCCIHPGRLTAYHEGLPVTSGKRYILVSFVN